jgi:methane monooxygenase PmoA-like
MRRSLSLLTVALILCGGLAATGSRAGQPRVSAEVRISAGSIARRNTPVSFPLPGAAAASKYALTGAGQTLPVQVSDGIAWAIIPEVAAGATTTLQLGEVTGTGASKTAINAERRGEDVQVTSRGRPVAHYVGGAGVLPAGDIKPIFQRGGYIHPIHTPSGRIVTADYPADHRHHHGIWFAWTRAVFQGRDTDFWNMGDAKGRVEFEALDRAWSGPVHAGLAARHRYVDLTSGAPITVLREEWVTRFFEAAERSPYFTFDVEVRQTNIASSPLVLPEYHYGGIAVRGAADFVPLENVVFVTSEGKDRKTGDAAPSRWAYIAGTISDARAGIAILADPRNFRAPEPMRIHPTDPYLCYVPSRGGQWEIPVKGSHTARYRFVAFDGSPEPTELERLWRDYAEPPAVTVRTK